MFKLTDKEAATIRENAKLTSEFPEEIPNLGSKVRLIYTVGKFYVRIIECFVISRYYDLDINRDKTLKEGNMIRIRLSSFYRPMTVGDFNYLDAYFLRDEKRWYHNEELVELTLLD